MQVKDQKEYSFDPADTVLNICKIYVNLSKCDSFCVAVSQDGRSYSPQLFKLAEDVLIRIGGGALVCELEEVALKVAGKSAEYQANEVALAGAPEHFLDPIMSTLMLDPVILPSSKQTVDRSTIARYIYIYIVCFVCKLAKLYKHIKKYIMEFSSAHVYVLSIS